MVKTIDHIVYYFVKSTMQKRRVLIVKDIYYQTILNTILINSLVSLN